MMATKPAAFNTPIKATVIVVSGVEMAEMMEEDIDAADAAGAKAVDAATFFAPLGIRALV